MEYDLLAPPLLDGTIPAFYSNDQGIVITIPFSMNRVVSIHAIKGFQVKIKTVQSSTELYSEFVEYKEGQDNKVTYIISDAAIKNKFRVGQFYKIQLAYVNKAGVVGYYSSVAIAKYTSLPAIKINQLQENILNSHNYTYIGVYDQSGANKDQFERVYSYKFNLYDVENNLIDTSGDLLHSVFNDDLTEPISKDEYTFSQDLDIGKTYRIEYVVTTVNGLTVRSPRYRISQKQSISPEINASIEAALNYDNGYVDITMKADSVEELSSGFFMVVRACEDTNFTVWDELCKFSLMAQVANRHLYRDFTVEQGKKYVYGLQQYNQNQLRSNRILSNTLFVDFEDAFLFDGKRQLKIKYNPKVASFKKNLLETKTDTIGGKHPFIFRNGNVYYSEFSISGLISYQMDEENLFLSEEEYGLIEKTTNLTGENFAAERVFKMKVLEWLTNGESKVFRSPSEGNFIVRLMNSSLAPNETLGRLLHTFTSTAYEIADFNYETLNKMRIIDLADQDIKSLQWETIELKGPYESNQNLLRYKDVVNVRFDNMMPGEVIKITFNNGVSEEIKIGVTGSYYIDTGMKISRIELQNRSASSSFVPAFGGTVTYSYEFTREPIFNTISDVQVIEMPQHQFIGEHDILKELLYVYDDKNRIWIKNPKLELIDIYFINVEKRPLQRLSNFVPSNGTAYQPNKYYIKDSNHKYVLASQNYYDSNKLYYALSNEDDFLIYELGMEKEEIGTMPSRPKKVFTLLEFYDMHNAVSYDDRDKDHALLYQPLININDNIISIDETESANYMKPGKLSVLKSGNGVFVNLAYQMGIITYTIEDMAYNNKDNTSHHLYKLGQAIHNYKVACDHLDEVLSDTSTATISQMESARQSVKSKYDIYIIELVAAQEEEARRRGEIV